MGIWLGEIDSYLHANLKGDIDALVLADRLVLPGHRDHDIGDYLSAADVFASVAREDPYPTAVLEAISTGLPVLAFEGAGGAPELIKELACGAVVPALRVPDMAARAVQLGLASQLSRRRTRQDDRFDFGAYVRSLLGVVVPALPRISAVVLSANYERYMQSRLSSIFRQKVPLHEIIVIDDHSSDSSVDLARKIAADFGREVRIIASDKRSGRVMLQWEKAIEAATGDYLWIAEADDHGSDDLLAVLINAMRGRDIVMAFADSAAIDQNGDVMWNSHADYYRSCGAEALLNQTYFPAREFAEVFLRESNLVINVSATLWRRTALADAFRKWRNELVALQAAGDWLLYFAALHTSEQEVAFVNEPLNYHRRHALSVTSRTTPDARDEEIRFVAERIQSRVSATGLRAAE